MWSQYLEVGIGPDAEVFTKAQPLSAVGTGAEIGLHPASHWNNPEPEVVLVIAPDGRVVGATLGNDVNLRDFEGRSALLLGKGEGQQRIVRARAVRPAVRRQLRDRRRAPLRGDAACRGRRRLRAGGCQQHAGDQPRRPRFGGAGDQPDAPISGRPGAVHGDIVCPCAGPGRGRSRITHKEGDVVSIAAPEFGALINRVTTSDKAPPWTFGVRALMRNLAARGLLEDGIASGERGG